MILISGIPSSGNRMVRDWILHNTQPDPPIIKIWHGDPLRKPDAATDVSHVVVPVRSIPSQKASSDAQGHDKARFSYQRTRRLLFAELLERPKTRILFVSYEAFIRYEEERLAVLAFLGIEPDTGPDVQPFKTKDANAKYLGAGSIG